MAFETEEQYQAKIRELEKEVKKLNLIIQKDSKTKYGLRWIDVPEAFEKDSENKIPILEEAKDKAIKNDDGKPTHILIEGDNYHALKCLNYTHKGKIDVIYIDPPYNTGSDGFTYKDKRFLSQFPDGTTIPKEHPLRHSTWLSFMSKRLELAKNLLSEKGVIFISIDDNEQANLKLLCDQIFGEECFVTTLHVEMSATQGMKVKAAQMGNIVKNAEYVLIYSKDGHKDIARNLLYDFRPEYDSHYSYLLSNDKKSYRPIIDAFLEKYPSENKENIVSLYESSNLFRHFVEENIDSIFRFDKTTGFKLSEFEQGKIYFKYKSKDREYSLYNNGQEINQLMFLSDSFGQCDDFKKNYGLRKIRGDWWKDFYKDMGNVSKEGNVKYQNGKKPLRLIRQIIRMASKPNSIVLDFFGGSATTAHATIFENFEDNGTRQFIICQSQEKEKICETITYKRIHNAMYGYKLESGKAIHPLGNSLKYYRTAFVGENEAEYATDKDKILLSKKAGYLLSMAENTLEEYFSTDRYQIFGDDKNSFTGIYFSANADKISEFTAKLEQLRNLCSLNVINAYFFSSGDGTEFSDEFESLKNIKIKSIPEPILEVYRRLN